MARKISPCYWRSKVAKATKAPKGAAARGRVAGYLKKETQKKELKKNLKSRKKTCTWEKNEASKKT